MRRWRPPARSLSYCSMRSSGPAAAPWWRPDMYIYDDIDQRMVDERVAQFRDQTRRFLDGKLAEDEFRALRLRNGLYIQRYAPMLRIAIPYGLLSSRQLRKLADIARRFDRGYGHFSTRQNLQLNWPKLHQVPDILAELATVQMHAIQTSGNCVRNVTTDHFAGVAPDEIFDSFVWCELIRQWSTFNAEFSYLPRKFKIAVNGALNDRAATYVHDIGLHAVKRDGEVGFKVIVGGGPGPPPLTAQGGPGRRPRPHAAHRPGGARVPALAASAHLPRRDPARLQPLRPPRQHPQGPHQDPAEGMGLRALPRRGGSRVGSSQGRPGDAQGERYRACRGPLYAPGLRQTRSTCGGVFRARLRCVEEAQRPSAQGARLLRGDVVAQEDWRTTGRCYLRADGSNSTPRRALFVWRAARLARAEPDPSRRARGCIAGAVARSEGARPRHPER